MKKYIIFHGGVCAFLFSFCLFLFFPALASAHCDTMAGPVIQDAKTALEKGDITPVLKWVKKDQEQGVRVVFKGALAAKTKAPAVKEKADMQFFETLVKIHRAGEGAPFTGLKPGEAIEPIVAAADKSLETGTSDDLVKQVTDEVATGIRKRFDKVSEKRKHVNERVKAGREYVAAYVEFTHYVEDLYQKAVIEADHHHREMKVHNHGKSHKEKKETHHKH